MSLKTPEINIKPEILRWARESIGLDLEAAAKRISVKTETLVNWEQKESNVSLPKLRKLANVYKRSMALFLLPQVPNVPLFPPDFRTLDSLKTDKLSEAARLSIRKAERNREFFVELQKTLELGVKYPKPFLSLDQRPEDAASQFRKEVKVTFAIQIEWPDKVAALRNWINIVEGFGVLVFQMPLPVREFRAFCIRGNNSLPPVIVLNTKDDPHGRIFSLIHEVSHLLIKQESIDHLIKNRGEVGAHKFVESFANEFAGSFLVPAENLLQNKYTAQYLENESDYAFQKLKSQFKVSGHVILRRLLNLNKINQNRYDAQVKILDEELEKYRQKVEAKKIEQKKLGKNGFKNVGMESFQKAGQLLTGQIFNAVSQGKISAAEVARFYEIKQKHISKIKTLFEGRIDLGGDN